MRLRPAFTCNPWLVVLQVDRIDPTAHPSVCTQLLPGDVIITARAPWDMSPIGDVYKYKYGLPCMEEVIEMIRLIRSPELVIVIRR